MGWNGRWLVVLSTLMVGCSQSPNATAFDGARRSLRNCPGAAGSLPGATPGDAAIAGIVDAWGNAMQYRLTSESRFEIVSAGPDGQFDTDDDVRHSDSHSGLWWD